MKIRQIFKTGKTIEYNGLKAIKFCPVCSAPFETKMDNGRERPSCPQCGFIYYKNPAPAVSVLIVDQGHILLGKRGPGSFLPGKWCLPCGFIECSEDFLTAAVREVKEETGLDVAIRSIINICSNFLSSDLHSLVVVLLAEVAGGDAAASNAVAGDDLEALTWIGLTDPLPEMAFEADIHIIERYREDQLERIAVDTDFEVNQSGCKT